MLAIIGLIYEFADTSWETSLSKELKFERYFFFQLPQSNSKIKLFVAEKEKSLTLKVFSQKSSLFLWLQVTNARKFIRKIGPRNCFPIWLHLVAFTCLGEFIKEGSVKMQVCGKKRFSNTHVWTINFFFFLFIFFFARQIRPSIKQVIIEIYCFKGTTHNNNLHVLYQKAMKLSMYEMMNLWKHSSLFHTTFYSTTEQIALGNR